MMMMNPEQEEQKGLFLCVDAFVVWQSCILTQYSCLLSCGELEEMDKNQGQDFEKRTRYPPSRI